MIILYNFKINEQGKTKNYLKILLVQKSRMLIRNFFFQNVCKNGISGNFEIFFGKTKKNRCFFSKFLVFLKIKISKIFEKKNVFFWHFSKVT